MSIQRRLDADSCRRIAQILAEPDVNSEEPKTVEAHCPDGKRVFTGGARVASAASFPATAAASLTWLSPTPRADVQLTRWVARAGEPSPTDRDWSLVVWVRCSDDPAASGDARRRDH